MFNFQFYVFLYQNVHYCYTDFYFLLIHVEFIPIVKVLRCLIRYNFLKYFLYLVLNQKYIIKLLDSKIK